MKNRKPTLAQQKAYADELLFNEIKIRKACIASAKVQIDQLIDKITHGDNSLKTQRKLAELAEIANNNIAWVRDHSNVA